MSSYKFVRDFTISNDCPLMLIIIIINRQCTAECTISVLVCGVQVHFEYFWSTDMIEISDRIETVIGQATSVLKADRNSNVKMIKIQQVR